MNQSLEEFQPKTIQQLADYLEGEGIGEDVLANMKGMIIRYGYSTAAVLSARERSLGMRPRIKLRIGLGIKQNNSRFMTTDTLVRKLRRGI